MDSVATFQLTLDCPATPVLSAAPALRVEWTDPVAGTAQLVVQPTTDESSLEVQLIIPFAANLADATIRETAMLVLTKLAAGLTVRAGLLVERPRPEYIRDDVAKVRFQHEAAAHSPRGEGVGFVDGHSSIRGGGRTVRTWPIGLEAHLTEDLSRPIEALWLAYQQALCTKDPTGEFILQYGILATIYGDRQEVLDNAIDPHKLRRTHHPCARNRDGETPFTRVRNELAHPKSRQRPLHEVASEALSLQHELRGLVRSHVLQHLGWRA